MKKRIFVIASAIVVVAIIVGSVIFFTTKNKDEDVDEDILGSSLSEETLTFYFPGEEPKMMSAVLEEIQKQSKSALNSKLVFKFLDYGEYATSIKDIASSGEACDAFFYSNQYNLSLADLDREGIIMDLSKVFPQDAPNYYSKFSKDELKAASINGKLMAVPNHRPYTQRKYVLVREDLMKKYNIPDIKSYSDYELYLKTVKSNEPTGTPMVVRDSSIGLFAEANGYAVLDRNLGLVYKWDDPDMKIIPWEQTPEFKNLTNSIIKWFTNGYAQPGDYIGSYNLIEQGKVSSFISTSSDVSINSVLQSNGIEWKYKAYSLYPDKPSERSSPLSTALVINSKAKNAGVL
jgi:putative aldouronate transport system substrate-binding protein